MSKETDNIADLLARLDTLDLEPEERKRLCARVLADAMDSMAGGRYSAEDIDMVERLTREVWGGNADEPVPFCEQLRAMLDRKKTTIQ